LLASLSQVIATPPPCSADTTSHHLTNTSWPPQPEESLSSSAKEQLAWPCLQSVIVGQQTGHACWAVRASIQIADCVFAQRHPVRRIQSPNCGASHTMKLMPNANSPNLSNTFTPCVSHTGAVVPRATSAGLRCWDWNWPKNIHVCTDANDHMHKVHGETNRMSAGSTVIEVQLRQTCCIASQTTTQMFGIVCTGCLLLVPD